MKLRFFFKFFKNPFINASVIESSKSASTLMLKGIEFENLNTILEFGPGSGIFTDHYIDKIKNANLILIEYDLEYFNFLKDKYKEVSNIKVINDSAANFLSLCEENDIKKVDLIISGIPFLYGKEGLKFKKNLKSVASSGTKIRMFTYMPIFFKKVYKDFNLTKIGFTFKNFPPFWVFEIK